MRFDYPARAPVLWVVASLIVFAWLSQAPAARPEPCSVEVLKAMSECGMSGYEADRVCYYAAHYASQNQTLSGAEALLKALRKLGLAQDFILEKISTALLHDERAMLKLKEPKRPATERTDGAKVQWELRARERDPLAGMETDQPVTGDEQTSSTSPSHDLPWYKVDEHALFEQNPSDHLSDFGEDLDLMLKFELKF